MATLILITGILGLLLSTFALPLLLSLFALCLQKRRNSSEISPSIAILIPAHNEGHVIHETLTSIVACVNHTKSTYPDVRAEIIVCLDDCTDETFSVAKRIGAKVITLSHTERGKWHALKKLTSHTKYFDITALVDAGSIWPKELLVRSLPDFKDTFVAGVLPGYAPIRSSLLSRCLWGIEAFCKRLESRSGGPISAHGATALYRTKSLHAAFAALTKHDWLNDDVVIPLAIRTHDRNARLIYRSDLIVRDRGAVTGRVKSSRRLRLARGNLEWLRWLYPDTVRHNRFVSVLAVRRIARMLWGYWVVATLAGSQLVIASQTDALFGICALILLMGALLLPWASDLRNAFFASLRIPFFSLSMKEVWQ